MGHPTRAPPDKNDNGNGRGKGGSKLEAPGEFPDTVKYDIGAVPDKHAERHPHLEASDETTPDGGRSDLGREDWDGGNLDAHADAHEKTTDEETPPVLGKGLGKDGEDAEETSEEDGATAAHEIVNGIGSPGTDEAKNGGTRVDEADEPTVVLDTEFGRERQVGTVGTSVVPALDGRSQGAEANGKVQLPRQMPAMCLFTADVVFVVLGQLV